jgi:hypothetical protein
MAGLRSTFVMTSCLTASKLIAPSRIASSAAVATITSEKTSISRSTWMNSRLPRLPMRTSNRRRRCWRGSGNVQLCKGAA